MVEMTFQVPLPLPVEYKRIEGVRVYSAQSGGELRVLCIDADAFGVVGGAQLQDLAHWSKPQRRGALRCCEKLLRTFKIIMPEETLIAAAWGAAAGGAPIILVATTTGAQGTEG